MRVIGSLLELRFLFRIKNCLDLLRSKETLKFLGQIILRGFWFGRINRFDVILIIRI